MKTKRLGSSAMALAIAAGVFAVPVMATDGKNDGEGTNPENTIVSYNNANVIPDPDGAPAKWGVEVPKAITFTDQVNSIKADVKLVDLSANGNPGYPTAAAPVTVKVQSKNGYVMELSDPDEKDPLQYTLGYTQGGGMVNAPIAKETDFVIGALHDGNKKIPGLAVKLSTAQQTGNHTDRLVYTISTTK